MNDIDIDLARPDNGCFATAWPKIVTANLPCGGTSQAIFYADGRVVPTTNAPRVAVGK